MTVPATNSVSSAAVSSAAVSSAAEGVTRSGGVIYEETAVSGLDRLGLSVASAQLDQSCQRAAAEGWSYSHFLGYLLQAELDYRHQKTVALTLQFSHLPYQKRLEEFDFDAQPSIDRRLVEELATCRFLYEGRNIIFLGPPGVGKTHLAISLALLTAEKEHRIYFTTAVDMGQRLAKAMSENRLHREMNKLTHPKLLLIDEMGYLSLDAVQSSLVFQAICRRYDRGLPIILTSNKSFTDWGAIFGGDAVIAAAALDRLLHRCTTINIRGESYRLKDRRHPAPPELLPNPAHSGPAHSSSGKRNVTLPGTLAKGA